MIAERDFDELAYPAVSNSLRNSISLLNMVAIWRR